MTMQTHNTDVAILNMEPGDEVLHGNVLMVYEDQQDSPSCTAAVVGHLLRFADQEAVPFESGTLIITVPFRIETSRLGKPVEQVTPPETRRQLLSRAASEESTEAACREFRIGSLPSRGIQ